MLVIRMGIFMPKRNYNTITIFPYLHLVGEIKFDELRIWPFHKYKNTKITDVNLSNHIEKVLKCYTHVNGRPISQPAIVTDAKYGFPNVYRKTIDKIEHTKQAMLIPAILKMKSWSFVTSENFSSYYQRFQVGNDGIATQAGAIHTITTGGYKMNEIQFQKPEYVNAATQPIDFDIPTLTALLDIYKDRESDNNKANIYNSLGPFFYSYKNTNDIPIHTRILNLIMAFELLFGQTDRANFRNNILSYTSDNPSAEPTYAYNEVSTKTGNIIRTHNLTLSQIWAEEFYKLRHKIIHGSAITSSDFIFKDLNGYVHQHDPHFYIAVNMFVVCILRKLRDLGYQNIPKYYISTKNIPIHKNISGITNELFKIEDRGLHDLLAGL